MEQTLTEPCAIGRPLSRVQMGNYLLLRELGQGGYANVYLAEHLYLKHQVALKLLNLSLTQHEDLVRFQFAIQDETLVVKPCAASSSFSGTIISVFTAPSNCCFVYICVFIVVSFL